MPGKSLADISRPSVAVPETDMLELTVESPHEPECIQMVEALWADEGIRYGDTGPCRFTPESVEGSGCRFVLARLDGIPSGCGAIRPLEPGIAEVKRVFVMPAARRQGIARRILVELETLASSLSYCTLRLETGIYQPEAIALYEAAGFVQIPCWGHFASDPLSVCLEKRI